MNETTLSYLEPGTRVRYTGPVTKLLGLDGTVVRNSSRVSWSNGEQSVHDREYLVPVAVPAEEDRIGVYIVVVRQNGQFKPAETPRVYASKNNAIKVASAMATKHGGEFAVFEAIASAERPVVPAVTVKEFRK